jgi:uncharacterized membrane protein
MANIGPYAVVELVAWWPLVIGLIVLILRRRIVTIVQRNAKHRLTPERQRSLSLAILFGALFFVTMGLGAFVWSAVPSDARAVVLIVVLATAIPLSVLLSWHANAARPKDEPPGA